MASAAIRKVMDDLSNTDLPPATRKKLEALLKRLQAQRKRTTTALEKCEMAHMRRHR